MQPLTEHNQFKKLNKTKLKKLGKKRRKSGKKVAKP